MNNFWKQIITKSSLEQPLKQSPILKLSWLVGEWIYNRHRDWAHRVRPVGWPLGNNPGVGHNYRPMYRASSSILIILIILILNWWPRCKISNGSHRGRSRDRVSPDFGPEFGRSGGRLGSLGRLGHYIQFLAASVD